MAIYRVKQEDLNTMLSRVRKFQESSQQLINTSPTLIPHDQVEFRDELMNEEVRETRVAGLNNDLVEVLDGLCDQLYVLLGTVNTYGLQDVFEEAFMRVCDSNDTKLTGGKLIKHRLTGKVLKPDTFVPVQLEDLIKGTLKKS